MSREQDYLVAKILGWTPTNKTGDGPELLRAPKWWLDAYPEEEAFVVPDFTTDAGADYRVQNWMRRFDETRSRAIVANLAFITSQRANKAGVNFPPGGQVFTVQFFLQWYTAGDYSLALLRLQPRPRRT